MEQIYIGESGVNYYLDNYCILAVDDDTQIAHLPKSYREDELKIFDRGYKAAYDRAYKNGLSMGKTKTQQDILKALGVTDAINYIVDKYNLSR